MLSGVPALLALLLFLQVAQYWFARIHDPYRLLAGVDGDGADPLGVAWHDPCLGRRRCGSNQSKSGGSRTQFWAEDPKKGLGRLVHVLGQFTSPDSSHAARRLLGRSSDLILHVMGQRQLLNAVKDLRLRAHHGKPHCRPGFA